MFENYDLEVQNNLDDGTVEYKFDRVISMDIHETGNIASGLTTDRRIQKGNRIGGKYIVEDAEINRMYSIAMLRVINNGK